MAFIKLKNLKGETIRIPKSAAKSYENLGFYPEEQFEDAVKEDLATDVDEDTEDVDQKDGAEIPEGIDEEENFINVIQKKPLASWNKEEVKRYASIFGIDLSGTKSANEAKERIKAFMADAE